MKLTVLLALVACASASRHRVIHRTRPPLARRHPKEAHLNGIAPPMSNSTASSQPPRVPTPFPPPAFSRSSDAADSPVHLLAGAPTPPAYGPDVISANSGSFAEAEEQLSLVPGAIVAAVAAPAPASAGVTPAVEDGSPNQT